MVVELWQSEDRGDASAGRRENQRKVCWVSTTENRSRKRKYIILLESWRQNENQWSKTKPVEPFQQSSPSSEVSTAGLVTKLGSQDYNLWCTYCASVNPTHEDRSPIWLQTCAVKVSSLSVCETHKQNTEHHRNAHEKINNSSFSESFGLY